MDFDLRNLLAWVRRWGSDQLTLQRESFTSDGTGEFELAASADALISLVKVTSDGDLIALNSTTLDGNILSFDPVAAVEGARVLVNYQSATYRDDDVLDTIGDAARDVGAELGISWYVNPSTRILQDVPLSAQENLASTLSLSLLLQKLIALKASLQMLENLGTKAAGDAILVKDGDTTIDTSKAASARAGNQKNVNSQYDKALLDAKTRRFSGSGN